MTALVARSISAAPWGPTLLEKIDLSIEAGKILGIAGPNGAGKSSLLHTLAGSVQPSKGQLLLGDRPLHQWPQRARAQCLAVLPQLSTLGFPYTVEEVVLLGRTPHNSGRNVDLDIMVEALRATDTEYLRGRLYTHLSGGERQRVQLARVLAQVWRAADSDIRVLLLDEPTAALDLCHQQLVAASLKTLADRGGAIAVVLHDFNLLAQLADRVIILDEGRIVAGGTPVEVFKPELFAQTFRARVRISPHPDTGKPLVIAL